MSLDGIISSIVEFVRDHHAWAGPIVFVLAFLESLAFLSLLVPATAILLAISGLVGAAGISFWPLWFAGGIGGVIGYSLSYQIGAHFGDRTFTTWPLRDYPALVERSRTFFEKWGIWAVFFGHFVGPIRAVVPVVGGVYGIPRWQFEIANVIAAFVWITTVLAPGFLGASWLFGD